MHAMRLGKELDPLMSNMEAGTAFGHFIAGRYAEAASWAEKALQNQPTSSAALRILAASHANAGRQGSAEMAIARLAPA